MIEPSEPLTTREVAEAVLVDGAHRSRLLRYASSHLGLAAEDAEDLLQETALELLRQRSRVRKPEGFVFTVFRARCSRFLQARKTRRTLIADGTALGSEIQAEDSCPIALDQLLSLREALGTVSSTCRRLLAAYYVEGQSLREAATAVRLASSSVTKTISRCLRRLKACLE